MNQGSLYRGTGMVIETEKREVGSMMVVDLLIHESPDIRHLARELAHKLVELENEKRKEEKRRA